MKAYIYEKYGPPKVLQLKEIEQPKPNDNEVLIKVHAATVNRTDCANLRAKPFIMRFTNGFFKPKKKIPGTDFAGQVESIGKNVSSLKAGDKVFGFDDAGLCSHAQYLSINEHKAFLMPANSTFEQAAASIEGAHYAYNFINKVELKPEHRVLINGATGAIGSAMVQLTKTNGCNITAVCGTKNIKMVSQLGADSVIDYQKEDFTKRKEQYDFVFDAVGKSTFGKCKVLLKPGGRYISSELGPFAQNLIYALFSFLTGKKKVIFPLPVDIKKSTLLIRKLSDEGKFKPVIDKTYQLEELAEAFNYVLGGQKIGNVVVKISNK